MIDVPGSFAELMQAEAVILGLENYPTRVNCTVNKLQQAGFTKLKVHYGIDGRQQPAKEIGKTYGWNYAREEDAGSIGFTISMLQIWKQVFDQQLPYLLIFEDDALPHPAIACLGEQYWAETPKDWDFLMLGCGLPAYLNQDKFPLNNRIVSQPVYCTHAFVISQQGAKRAFELIKQDGCIYKLDCQMWDWMCRRAIKYYCWNGNAISRPFKLSSDSVSPDEDVIWEHRCSGLVYQNYKLKSVISGTAERCDD